MAGAGYKLFNTGDVLTAAQVNTYLMEQTVMVFADAAARTTALSGVVSEGMISYLKDTNAVEVYNGSAWVASDDPNAIQNTIVDAKGDLISASAADVPARLAVGNNGESLVADSSTTTGLRWQGDWNTGKNKIINGDFGIWQRGTSFNNPGSATYTADRWRQKYAGTPTTWSVSRQAFTAGTAPVAGYESEFFYRSTLTTVGTLADYDIQQPIEDVRTFANQTVTLSFWAKADSARSSIVYLAQNFGSGGSADVIVSTPSISYTTSWQRFSFTFSVPSVSGKTIGAGSSLLVVFRQAVANGSVLDIWGVQVEAGSVATPFTTATGTLAGELAACQRYYYRQTATAVNSVFGFGIATSTTAVDYAVNLPVSMRVSPTAIDYSTLEILLPGVADYAFTALAIDTTASSLNWCYFGVSGASGLTASRSYMLRANNSTSAYIGFTAEL